MVRQHRDAINAQAAPFEDTYLEVLVDKPLLEHVPGLHGDHGLFRDLSGDRAQHRCLARRRRGGQTHRATEQREGRERNGVASSL